jgi:anti-anti-sigma factor
MIVDPLTHHSLRCSVEPHRETVRVRPVGEIDLATVDIVERQLSELKAAGVTALTLDLRAVSFLDSSGLRMILRWNAQAAADGFAFRLIEGPSAVRRLFDVTGTTERFDYIKP